MHNQVRREPVIREADSREDVPPSRADLAVQGVRFPQSEVLLDIRIVDTDAKSYVNRSPKEVLGASEKEKKARYSTACEERRTQFTPLCFLVDGLTGSEAETFLKRLGDGLAVKWEISYSQVMGWLRARLSFDILRASFLCLRGSCTKWRGLELEDGAPIGLSGCDTSPFTSQFPSHTVIIIIMITNHLTNFCFAFVLLLFRDQT